jgi:hypothetical protein
MSVGNLVAQREVDVRAVERVDQVTVIGPLFLVNVSSTNSRNTQHTVIRSIDAGRLR